MNDSNHICEMNFIFTSFFFAYTLINFSNHPNGKHQNQIYYQLNDRLGEFFLLCSSCHRYCCAARQLSPLSSKDSCAEEQEKLVSCFAVWTWKEGEKIFSSSSDVQPGEAEKQWLQMSKLSFWTALGIMFLLWRRPENTRHRWEGDTWMGLLASSLKAWWTRWLTMRSYKGELSCLLQRMNALMLLFQLPEEIS